MADYYLIRTKGGPYNGETRRVPRDYFGWPLPDVLSMPSFIAGCYRKIRESELPEDVDSNPHVARGAEYEWVKLPDD